MSLRQRFAQLAAASAISQALPMAMAPLLTRTFGAEVLGQWAWFAAIVASLAVVANARYEYAIPLPRRRGEAGALLSLSLALALVATLATALLAWALAALPGGALGGRWAQVGWLNDYAPALALAVGLLGLQQGLALWNNRHGRFAVIAQARVGQQVVMALAQLAAVAMGWLTAAALVGAQLLSLLLPPLWLWWRGQRVRLRSARTAVAARRRWRRVRALVWRYRQFPLVNSPHAFINGLQEAIALSLIATCAGLAAAGWYAVMVRLVKAPATLVGGALSEALLSRLAEDWREGRSLQPTLARAMRGLLLPAVGGAVLLALVGPALFGWALGADWTPAGEYARWMAPYVAAHFVCAPLTVAPMVTQRQTGALAFSLVGNALYVLALVVVLASGRPVTEALGAVSVVMPLYFAAYLAWLYRGAVPPSVVRI
ncbi:oligosaccharide flippase family protein [Roseateles asaccharophilus]|uniref:O-antigen/teichoic acid export membrane protein n=1 Tax=Roseateles asaccharophilus TaxID=582607 RepID=A0ABU2ABW7_9BURK|nr:oligosaccharide flippase family protein [Roseateles asaccharophilus]MDR7334688.1 O-antigen/teichoic acid export membrane protein [Roseateles asaccharophilus]